MGVTYLVSFSKAQEFVTCLLDQGIYEKYPNLRSAPPNETPATPTEEDPIATIERLAKLMQMGAITNQEFEDKKSELLKRI